MGAELAVTAGSRRSGPSTRTKAVDPRPVERVEPALQRGGSPASRERGLHGLGAAPGLFWGSRDVSLL